MSLITFTVTVEFQNEENLTDHKLNEMLTELEDTLVKSPLGFDLYDSEWNSEED
jgi:hypothetical protein